MDLDITTLLNDLLDGAVRLLLGLLILLVFYIVARLLRTLIKRLLNRTRLDNRFAEAVGGTQRFPIESALGEIVFWTIMIIGLITFFDFLNFEQITGPLNNLVDDILGFLPNLGGAIILLIVAWAVASIVKAIILRLADMFELDSRLRQLDGEDAQPPSATPGAATYTSTTPQTSISRSIATAAYYFVFLLFLPLILETLELQGLLLPLQDMFTSFFEFLPRLVAAALILLIGLFIARLVRQILTNLLMAVGVDRYATRAGLTTSLARFIGTLAYTVVLLLVIVQALNALEVESIARPATAMIGLIFAAIPNIIGALLVLAISYYIGKLIASLVSELLTSAGFDTLPERMGLRINLSRQPSDYVGYLVLVGIMLLATLSAVDLLGFEDLSQIVQQFVEFAGQVLLGIIVLGIGLFLANFVYNMMTGSGFSRFTSSLVRAVVLLVVGAMALDFIGIGDDIVQLAFGIGLGAIGIAAALAFGLGSRDIAGREVERFVSSVRSTPDQTVGEQIQD